MARASKSELDKDGWPVDKGPLPFESLADPIISAIRQAYATERKDQRRSIRWTGPNIGEDERACAPQPKEALSAKNLVFGEDYREREPLETIVTLAIQLGIEQGRRIARSSERRGLLDETNGAVFTLKVGWDDWTELHTQSGILSNPVECLDKAIAALQDERSRIQRCPRARAVSKAGG